GTDPSANVAFPTVASADRVRSLLSGLGNPGREKPPFHPPVPFPLEPAFGAKVPAPFLPHPSSRPDKRQNPLSLRFSITVFFPTATSVFSSTGTAPPRRDCRLCHTALWYIGPVPGKPRARLYCSEPPVFCIPPASDGR